MRVEIDWSDGSTTSYSHRVLRGYCPCANCQGHQSLIRFVEGDSSELIAIEEVGDYALRFVWPDCRTGIYSYPHLRRLSVVDEQGLAAGQVL